MDLNVSRYVQLITDAKEPSLEGQFNPFKPNFLLSISQAITYQCFTLQGPSRECYTCTNLKFLCTAAVKFLSEELLKTDGKHTHERCKDIKVTHILGIKARNLI